jgi:hypothetical protein
MFIVADFSVFFGVFGGLLLPELLVPENGETRNS